MKHTINGKWTGRPELLYISNENILIWLKNGIKVMGMHLWSMCISEGKKLTVILSSFYFFLYLI